MKIVDNVIQLDAAAVTPKYILEQAIAADLTDCVVMGWDKDGEAWFGSTMSSEGDILWIMEQVKHSMITGSGYE
jgi:hypothetical protein